MGVTAQFQAFALDLLGAVRPVRARRMFGGVGYYAGELFFAIAADDMLYFKVDATSRGAYEAEGMVPFCPAGPAGRPMSYYAVPPRLYDDPEELALWVRRSLAVAAAAAATARPRPAKRLAKRPAKRPATRRTQ